MDTLVLSRAVYRRRYGTDMPEASVPSRFLEEVPLALVEELGGSRRRVSSAGSFARTGMSAPHKQNYDRETTHYSYEDEDQSATWDPGRVKAKPARPLPKLQLNRQHRRVFWLARQEVQRAQSTGGRAYSKRGFRPGQKVKHPKYGEGTVFRREGMGKMRRLRYNSLASV